MPTPARVVVLPAGPGPLRIDEIDLPDPGPNQVVVQQLASGVCHSQLHQMHGARPMPAVLGHESTGIVLAAGNEVTHVAEGDKVMVTWVPRKPGINRPPAAATLALADGTTAVSQNVFTWADRTIADEQYVVKLTEDVAMDVTSIIGCAVMTGAGAVVHTAGVQRGQSVAVIGVGGVGLSAIVAAKVVGADPIIAVDLDEAKLEVARQFGATATVNASTTDPVAGIRALTTSTDPSQRDFMGQPIAGADFVFDCIGLKVTQDQIVPAARAGIFGTQPGGTGVLVGVPRGNAELNSIDVLLNEKRFIGSIGGSCQPERDFPMFLDWYRDGRLDLDALVTARYSIDQINEATTDLEEGRISGRAILVFD
jgi:Zn-dependent alcohol dehydrogenase